MKRIYIDCETTGLDTVFNDVTEIAYIIEIDGKETEKGFYKVRPINFNNITEEALKVTNKTIDELLTYPESSIVLKDFNKVLDKYIDKYNREDKFVVMGYHVQFDLNMLESFFLKHNHPYFYSYFFKDPIDVFDNFVKYIKHFDLFKLDSYSLSSVYEFIFNENFEAHNAMNDIKATKKLYEYFRRFMRVLYKKKV